jgi:3-phenylpropionate/cinnamic acid dioxygenase small subunit
MDSYRAIENLLYTYAELIDLGDLPAMAKLFEHGEILAPSDEGGTRGTAAVLKMYEGSTRIYPDTGTPRTKHVTTNAIIDVDEAAGSATSRSYFTVFQQTDELPLQPIIAGRYHDSFERAGGAWRFRTRRMFVDLWGDLSKHLLFDAETIKPK